MTLLLGPPNSGKSTLLKLLAGHLRHSDKLSVSDDVRYNGKPASSFVLERTAAYVDQDDNHIPAYPVGSTLKFAWECQAGDRKKVKGKGLQKLDLVDKEKSGHGGAGNGAEGDGDAAAKGADSEQGRNGDARTQSIDDVSVRCLNSALVQVISCDRARTSMLVLVCWL